MFFMVMRTIQLDVQLFKIAIFIFYFQFAPMKSQLLAGLLAQW